MRGVRPLVTSFLLAAAVAACVEAPRTRAEARAARPAVPEQPLVTPTTAPVAPTTAPTAALVPFDASTVRRLLDDPRLAEANALLDAGKPLEAARSIERVEPSATEQERSSLAFLEARLRVLGGDPKGAALAFDRAAASAGPLRSFARLLAAETYETLGDHESAARRAATIEPTEVPETRRGLVLARSMVRSGKLDEGFERYRAVIATHPRGVGAVALELARALLAHPAEGRALEAAKLALGVGLDAPSGKGGEEAKKLETSAKGSLSKADRDALDAAPDLSPVARARRLVASGQSKRALSLLDKPAKRGELDCAGLVAHAEALAAVKREAESSGEYGRAIEACEKAPGDRDLAAVLFAGARAASKGGQLQISKSRYKRIEDAFHSHRLADDARLEGARVALEDGDVEAFDRMLGSIADDYPSGDMAGDGLFLLGLAHAERSEWAPALAAFQRGMSLPRERGYERAGRFAYFTGRALVAMGRSKEGAEAFASVIRDVPCGYYMALAYARLASLDPGAPKRALDEALARGGTLSSGVSAELLTSAAWKEAVALIEVDDPADAEAALGLLGVSDRSAPSETLWAAARLLALARDPVPSHRLLRTAFEAEPRTGKNEASAFRAVYPVGEARRAWEIAYPRPFATFVTRAADESGVSESLLYAVMREESAFEPTALSKASAVGLLQLIPVTAQKMARPLRLASNDAALREPAINLRLGARYLASMRRYFADDPLLAVPGYNAGRGAPDAWTRDDPSRDFDIFVETIPYAETRAYTKRVLSSLCAYELVYGDPDKSEALRLPIAVRPSSTSAP